MMKICKTKDSIQKLIKAARAKKLKIALVPTMGYLHAGHLQLVKEAKKNRQICIVSIFVNPTQFGPNEDLSKYPRDLKRDMELLKKLKVDALFLPTTTVMYPPGFSTVVQENNLTASLCGVARPSHFQGVTTVVLKLFNIITPDIAYFGMKDYQQLQVIKKMTTDLDLNITIKAIPIVRDKDGLALSSRNKYLSAAQRQDALSLNQSLFLAAKLVKKGEFSATKIINIVKKNINSKKNCVIDYVSIADPNTLQDIKKIDKKALLALAVQVGKARLIDNIILSK